MHYLFFMPKKKKKKTAEVNCFYSSQGQKTMLRWQLKKKFYEKLCNE